ncbi:MAG: alpha/beta fold hydrolase [Gemmatimonadota bacterium]
MALPSSAVARCILVIGAVACGAGEKFDGARLVDIGGRDLLIDCRGRGSPTVVLESGHTESSDTWSSVHENIAAFTRTCAYDRAGRGRSSPAPGSPRTGVHVVADLEQLLDASGESAPLVLVGHSLGAAFARLFAANHADDVAGLVLVDGVHEREFELIDSILTPQQREAGRGMRPLSPEGLDIEAIFAEVRRNRGSLLPMPVVVIARGRPLADDEFPPGWSADQRSAREALRRRLQEDLARISGEGRIVVATGSGHHVHHDEPLLLVGEVRSLVLRGRRNKQR